MVDQAFCSSWGDDAVRAAGGPRVSGRAIWRSAGNVPAAGGRPGRRSICAGSSRSLGRPGEGRRQEIAVSQCVGGKCSNPGRSRRVCPPLSGASGSLAGRTGAYAEIVALALGADHLAPPSQPDSRWPTFAGSLKRSKVVAGPIDVGSTQWRVELEKVQTSRAPTFGARMMGGVSTPNPPERLLAYHPIVLGDQVIVSDGARVLAYNLNDRPTGATATRFGRSNRRGSTTVTAPLRARRRCTCQRGFPATRSRRSVIESTPAWGG